MALFHVNGVPIGWTAISLALIASMGGFIFGYDTGQISDILLMDDFLARFATCTTNPPTDPTNQCAFSVVREGLIVALLSIGTLAGALFGAPVADWLGRRWAMVTECLVFIVGVIIQITAENVWQQVAVGRFVSGIGVGSLSAAVPIYQAETSPPQIRGTMTATYQLFITFGILVAYLISIGARNAPGSASWRTVVGIGIIWPLILIIGILLMPESPRWLIKRGKVEEAKASVARTRGLPYKHFLKSAKEHPESGNRPSYTSSDHSPTRTYVSDSGEELEQHPIISHEIQDMISHNEYERQFKAGWIDCFKPDNKILYRTILGFTLQMFQQLTGANYFFYYGATVFKDIGIPDSFVTQIILGAVNFFCTFGGLYVMEKFGRRVPLIAGGLWQAAWLVVFATAGTAKDPAAPGNKSIGILMIVSACFFIFGYAMTWAPGIWILIGETFPMRTRAKQGAIAVLGNWIWNFLIAFFTPFITADISYKYGYVFAGCNFLGAVIVYFFLYESSDLTLESVDMMYTDPNCNPRNSRSWAPPGYKDRKEFGEQVKASEAHKPPVGGREGEEERVEKIDSHAGASASR